MTDDYQDSTFEVDAFDGILGKSDQPVHVIHDNPGMVQATHRPDLDLIVVVWQSEYDAGSGARDAMMAALNYGRANQVRSGLVDLTQSSTSMKREDYAWVNSPELQQGLVDSGLRRFILAPPAIEFGDAESLMLAWERDTNAAFGDRIDVQLLSSAEEILEYLSTPIGETTK